MEREINLKEKFIVLFHGSFIPLQGIEYIVEAAKILRGEPDIIFYIIGKGQTYSKIIKLKDDLKLRNIKFFGPIPYEELSYYIKNANVCLGIFGKSEKAQRVIPNKIYESIAMAKAVISTDSPGIRELFADQENILLCAPADGNDLAKKILLLKNDAALRDKIARNGYNLFCSELTPKKIVADLLTKI